MLVTVGHPLRPDDSCRLNESGESLVRVFLRATKGTRGTRGRIWSHFWPTGGVLSTEGTASHGDVLFCNMGNPVRSGFQPRLQQQKRYPLCSRALRSAQEVYITVHITPIY